MSTGNLLLVDDEEMIIETLQILLGDLAENVYIAGNGREALEVLKMQNIHCIICDINMPKMNGLEFIKQVREAKNEVPFIFYTAYNSSDLIEEAVKYGAFDFLTKPNLDDIEDVVSRGLKEGISREVGKEVSPEESQQELKNLLNKLNS